MWHPPINLSNTVRYKTTAPKLYRYDTIYRDKERGGQRKREDITTIIDDDGGGSPSRGEDSGMASKYDERRAKAKRK